MSLHAMQRDFRRHLVGAEPGRMGHAVYHNAYRVRLADCLADTFPQTRAWLGGDAFATAARAHIGTTPPSGWTLDQYGAGFDGTLTDLYSDDPEVAELATLEWLLSRAFAGPDAAALPVAAIAAIDWNQTALSFVPTLRLAAARTNAAAIWSALVAEGVPPAPDRLPEPAALLVWRQDFAPCFRIVGADEADALGMMLTGAGFATLCARLVETDGAAQGVATAGAMLGQWFNDGLVTAVRNEEIPCA